MTEKRRTNLIALLSALAVADALLAAYLMPARGSGVDIILLAALVLVWLCSVYLRSRYLGIVLPVAFALAFYFGAY